MTIKIEMPKEIITKRLVLRKPSISDLNDIFRIHSDPQTNLHNPAGPHKTQGQTKIEIQSWIDDWDKDGIGYYTMFNKNGGGIIGVCGITNRMLKSLPVLNIYYRIEPESWRKGLTKEALKACLETLHSIVKETPIIMIRTKSYNTPSIEMAKSLGFIHNDKLDDYKEIDDVYYFNVEVEESS